MFRGDPPHSLVSTPRIGVASVIAGWFSDRAFLVLHSGKVGVLLLGLREVEASRQYISKDGVRKGKVNNRREFHSVNRTP